MGTSRLPRRDRGLTKRHSAAAVPVVLACLLSACASGEQSSLLGSGNGGFFSSGNSQDVGAPGQDGNVALAQAFASEPKNPDHALNYARVLKQQGDKRKALSVLAHSFQLNPNEPRVASAYGRLALDVGDVKTAEKVLPIAARNAPSPDWRLLSAQGTIAARRKKYSDAQRYFARALQLSPNEPTVLNNLALVYALDGKLGDAETLLRRAVATGSGNERLRKNLALIMKMRGSSDSLPPVAKVASDKPSTVPQPVATGSLPKPVPLVPKRKTEAKTPPAPNSGGLPKVLPLAPVKAKPSSRDQLNTVSKNSTGNSSSKGTSRSTSVAVARKGENTSSSSVGGQRPLIRRGTYDDSLSGWSFDVEG